MGAQSKDNLTARVDPDTRKDVEQLADQRGQSLAKAGEQLIETGLREAQSPLTNRVRAIALDAGYHLALVAAVVVIAGQTTTVMTAGHSMAVAVVTLAVAAAPVAAVELVRAVRGQSELGEGLRGGDR